MAGQHPGAAQRGGVFQLPGPLRGGGGGAAPTFRYLPAAAPPAELPALADCPREDSRFVLEQLYEADQAGRSLGREAILAAAREAGLPCSQQEVRRILAGLDRAGLVRVSRGRGGTRLTPAGRALCRRQTVEGGAEMV